MLAGMSDRRHKVWVFVLEGIAALATTFYGTYVFFLLRDKYGFGNVGNLSVAALQGLMGAVAAWQGGRFAQRCGYFTALQVGFGGMAVSLLAGWLMPGLVVQLLVLGGFITFACFVWPALEALVSEGESGEDLPRMVGIYNVVWGAATAVSFFCGGALFDHLGARSIFWLPAGIFGLEILLVWRLARRLQVTPHAPGPLLSVSRERQTPNGRPFVNPRMFLWLAWLANPFAGIGIYTLVAIIPDKARELHLSATYSGFFCSIWFFARLAAFLLLWRWEGWHYRFRWLLGAFLALMGGFATILLARNFWLLILAQISFGLAIGLTYYSSLFYSMDVGTTKGQHGGLHEAAMGAGNCLGPAVGAASLLLAPHAANAAGYAVSGLMAIGLVGLVGLRLRSAPRPMHRQ